MALLTGGENAAQDSQETVVEQETATGTENTTQEGDKAAQSQENETTTANSADDRLAALEKQISTLAKAITEKTEENQRLVAQMEADRAQRDTAAKYNVPASLLKHVPTEHLEEFAGQLAEFAKTGPKAPPTNVEKGATGGGDVAGTGKSVEQQGYEFMKSLLGF